MIVFFLDPRTPASLSQLPFTRYTPPCLRPIGPINLHDRLQSHFPISPHLFRLGEPTREWGESPIFINAHLIPSQTEKLLEQIRQMDQGGWIIQSGKEVIAWKNLGNSLPSGIGELLEGKLPIIKGDYETLNQLHEWITVSLKLLRDDIHHLTEGAEASPRYRGLWQGKQTEIHPSVDVDTSKGPIVLKDGVKVKAFSVLEGPLVIGNHSLINPNSYVGNSLIGDSVKIGGEVSSSVICNYSNKAHFGYLGNSFVGEWVNIGAGTVTSNLKNNYRTIRYLGNAGEEIESGETFLGAWLGDFSKIGINTSLAPGTVVGLGASGSGTLEGRIPDFAIVHGNGKSPDTERKFLKLSSFLETHGIMFTRRNFSPDPDFPQRMERIYRESLSK